jgi:hypothetical protein
MHNNEVHNTVSLTVEVSVQMGKKPDRPVTESLENDEETQ